MKTSIGNLLLALLLCVSFNSLAQLENSRWYFGNYAGLHFTPNGPIALTDGASTGHDGTASVSSPAGELLFYSNAENIWNKNHQVMVNGSNIEGSHTSTHGAIIVPKPENLKVYYVFTTDRAGWSKGLKYHTVDISLQGGLGEVVNKNTTLHTPVTEKLISVRHANGQDVWVLAHGFGDSKFLAYLVTSTGITTTPVVSNVGPVHGNAEGYAWGQMKCSPDGSKLALGVLSGNRYELYDFDPATGMVSNPSVITGEPNAYGVEFSPNGRYLYTTRLNHTNIFQYDLQAGSHAAIEASKVIIGTATVPPSVNAYSVACIQIGPDEKIYVTKWESPYLAVITNPNMPGMQSGFVDNGIHLGGQLSMGGLTNTVLPRRIVNATPSQITREINLYPNPANQHVAISLGGTWKEGDSGEIHILDMLGKEVFRASISQSNENIDTNLWSEGIYLVKVRINGSLFSAKLVVQ